MVNTVGAHADEADKAFAPCQSEAAASEETDGVGVAAVKRQRGDVWYVGRESGVVQGREVNDVWRGVIATGTKADFMMD